MGLVTRFLWDKRRYQRGTRLTMGNALTGRLLRSCVDPGVELWSSTPMIRLDIDSGRVTGAIVEKDGKQVKVCAKRGVILASGGFSANPEFRR